MARRSTALTQRQRAVVVMLWQGKSCVAIATTLGIRLATVRAHVQNINRLLEADPELPALRRIRKHAAELLDQEAA